MFKVMLHAIRCKWHNGPHPIGSMQVRALVLVDYTHDPETNFLGTTVVYLRTFFPYWNGHLSEQVWIFQCISFNIRALM